MDIKELYTKINAKRQNAGLEKISVERWVEEICVLELHGKIVNNNGQVEVNSLARK